MKKTGIFFFSFLPLIIVEAVTFFAMFATMFVDAFLSMINTGSYNPIEHLQDSDFSIVISIVYTLIIICSFGLWYYSRYEGNLICNVKKTFHPLEFVGLLICLPGLEMAISFVLAFTSALFPNALDKYLKLMETAGFDSMSPLLFIYAIILGPICEELIFRGITLRSIKRIFPFWAANLFQAVLFGIFHGNLIQGVYAAVLGLLLGYICEKGGSIYLAIFLHMIFNFWGSIISQYFEKLGSNTMLLLVVELSLLITFPIGMAIYEIGRKKVQQS